MNYLYDNWRIRIYEKNNQTLLATAATSSVTNIRKVCDNNGMSPDNTAQISHALSFIITSQHYIQFRHLKLCQPKF